MAHRIFGFLFLVLALTGFQETSSASDVSPDTYILVVRDVADGGDMKAIVCKEGKDHCRLAFSIGSGKKKQDVTLDLSFDNAAACFKFGSEGHYLVADSNPNFCMMQGSRKKVSLFHTDAHAGEVPGSVAQLPVIKSYGDPVADIEIALIPQAASSGDRKDHPL